MPHGRSGYGVRMLTRGATIGDRYLLEDPLASGGMSDVWVARDQVLHRRVALKAIAPRLMAEPGFAERFAGEARTLAALRHPGIVDVYDYGEADTAAGRIAYLVMELVEGESLADRLAAGPLEPGLTMGIVARAADALEAAHRAGVVHRDVKPANLLITEDGEVVIVDFGVATTEGAAQLTDPGKVLGTAAYMAPEQASKQPVTGATDVYALGAVAYHCLAGEPPFTGGDAVAVALQHVREEPPPLPEQVPAAARDVVMRALAKDPAARYPSAAAFAAAARAVGDPTTEHLTLPPVAVPSHSTRDVAPTEALPAGAYAAGAAAVPDGEQISARAAVGDAPPGGGGRKRYAVAAGAVTALAVGALLFAASPIFDRSPTVPTSPSQTPATASARPTVTKGSGGVTTSVATTPSAAASPRPSPSSAPASPPQSPPASPAATTGAGGPTGTGGTGAPNGTAAP